MDRLKWYIFLILIPSFVFSFTLQEGESFIANHQYDKAIMYFENYINTIITSDNMTDDMEKEYALANYYLALSYYKSEKYQMAYDTLSKVYDDNDKKLGFNILLGLIIIHLGMKEEDQSVITQGYSYLKKASLYEGIRLRNSFIVDRNGVKLRPKVKYTINRVNKIDPEGQITYEFYHKLLLTYYEQKNNLSALSVEYEKLILLHPEDETLYEKLFDLYEQLQYYDNFSFILKIYMKKFNVKKERKKFIKYVLIKIRADYYGKNYLECEKGLFLIQNDDFKWLTDEETEEYYTISLKLFSILNLKNNVLNILENLNIKDKISENFLITLGESVLFLYKSNDFLQQNEGAIDKIFQKIMDLGKKYYPDKLYTYLLIGEYFLAKEKFNDAEEIFNQLKDLPEDNIKAHLAYLKFLYTMAYNEYIAYDQNNDKIKQYIDDFFNEVNKINGKKLHFDDKNDTFDYFFIIGKMNFLKGIIVGTIDKNLSYEDLYKRDDDMQNAIDNLLKANSIDPNNPVLLNYLGWAYIYKRKFREAYDVYKTILQYYPYNSNARLQLKYIKNQLLK